MAQYTGLLRLKGLLDAYLTALAEEGDAAVSDAFTEFFTERPEVLAVTWVQGAGLSELTFELAGGARYIAEESRLVGAPPDHVFDAVACNAFANVLWNALDVLVPRHGFDVSVRATREGAQVLSLAA